MSDRKNREEELGRRVVFGSGYGTAKRKETFIIQLRFFEGKTQMEVADQIQISQAQVSRLEKNALKVMKQYLLG